MSRVRQRVAGLFVEPAPAESPIEAAPPGAELPVRWLPPVAPAPLPSRAPATEPRAPADGAPRRIAVIAARDDASLGSAAVALALLQQCGSPCAVVARWTGEEPLACRAAPATAAARRLAGALAADGHAAHASGRLAWLDLPADERTAVAAADRALRGATPGLLVVAGPRTDVLERALSACGAVILAAREAAEPELLAAAAAEIERLGPPFAMLRLGVSAGAAALCRAGVVLPAGLRGPVGEALAAAGVPA